MSQNIDLQAGIVLFLMCLVAGSISAFAAHQMIPPVLDWYRARDYAPVQARVQIPKNHEPGDRKTQELGFDQSSHKDIPVLEFEYSFDGVKYVSDQFVILQDGVSGAGQKEYDAAWKQAESALETDQPITVWVDSRNPQRVFMRRDIDWKGIGFWAFFALGFGFWAIAFLVMLLKALSKELNLSGSPRRVAVKPIVRNNLPLAQRVNHPVLRKRIQTLRDRLDASAIALQGYPSAHEKIAPIAVGYEPPETPLVYTHYVRGTGLVSAICGYFIQSTLFGAIALVALWVFLSAVAESVRRISGFDIAAFFGDALLIERLASRFELTARFAIAGFIAFALLWFLTRLSKDLILRLRLIRVKLHTPKAALEMGHRCPVKLTWPGTAAPSRIKLVLRCYQEDGDGVTTGFSAELPYRRVTSSENTEIHANVDFPNGLSEIAAIGSFERNEKIQWSLFIERADRNVMFKTEFKLNVAPSKDFF
jgi:hypothetical protein